MKNIVFYFSVVDYQYTLTVVNGTDLDIVRFKTYDYQTNNGIEKAGSSVFQSYPFGIGVACAVPARETVTLKTSVIPMRDCDSIVSYVYYLKFSDGTEWGTEFPVVQSIPDYALRFDVPFQISVSEQPTQGRDLFPGKAQSVSETVASCMVLIGIVALVFVLLNKKKKKQRTFQYEPAFKGRIANGSKGQIGEYIAYDKIDQIPGEKRLLHNVYIPKADGTKTEIDCLLIHQGGLFVIESKNYNGYIYGSATDNNWTQVLRKNRHYTFYNPVRQNSGHIKNLLTYLSYQTQDRYRQMPVFSIVAFAPSADLTNVNRAGLPENNIFVVQFDQLAPTIKTILLNQPPTPFTTADVSRIYDVLLPLTEVSPEERQKHIDSIR